jgi:hypothetical protein
MNRAFSAGLMVIESPGALPQAKLERCAFGAKHTASLPVGGSVNRPYLNFSPVSRSNASTYLAEVLSMISCGNRGAGGVLSQSSVSR